MPSDLSSLDVNVSKAQMLTDACQICIDSSRSRRRQVMTVDTGKIGFKTKEFQIRISTTLAASALLIDF